MSFMEQAKQDGEQANYDGLYQHANPHSPASVLHAYWLQGWTAAQAVRDVWEEANHERAKQFPEWMEAE